MIDPKRVLELAAKRLQMMPEYCDEEHIAIMERFKKQINTLDKVNVTISRRGCGHHYDDALEIYSFFGKIIKQKNDYFEFVYDKAMFQLLYDTTIDLIKRPNPAPLSGKICPKCECEIKERKMLYTTYIGCKC